MLVERSDALGHDVAVLALGSFRNASAQVTGYTRQVRLWRIVLTVDVGRLHRCFNLSHKSTDLRRRVRTQWPFSGSRRSFALVSNELRPGSIGHPALIVAPQRRRAGPTSERPRRLFQRVGRRAVRPALVPSSCARLRGLVRGAQTSWLGVRNVEGQHATPSPGLRSPIPAHAGVPRVCLGRGSVPRELVVLSYILQGFISLAGLITAPLGVLAVAALLLGGADYLPATWVKLAALTRSSAVLIVLGFFFVRS